MINRVKTKRSFLSRLLRTNAAVLVGGTAFTAYQYPELLKDPGQLFRAMLRGSKCGATGCLMAYDYLSCKEIGPEVHRRASMRMYECFKQCGGPYIKFGQMMGQLDNLVPMEYIEAFEPMLQQAPKTKYEDVKSIIELEFGRDLDSIFSEFAIEPVASASLG